jgi:hypothetical protein
MRWTLLRESLWKGLEGSRDLEVYFAPMYDCLNTQPCDIEQ